MYVHGYHAREFERLQDQADSLVDLLHHDTVYPDGAVVLEAGCGTGAQTITLAARNRGARFVSIDRSEESLRIARDRIARSGIANVDFRREDIFSLPFPAASFDHAFVCFVLEHLVDPAEALRIVKTMVKPGGTITVIEGDHGSTYFHPDSAAAREAVGALIETQRRGGGNALIGRQLYPLLVQSGCASVHVSPRMVYVDASRPALVDGFTRRTFTAMVEGVREQAVAGGIIERARFDQGIADLYRTAGADGVFCYCFFKGVAVV